MDDEAYTAPHASWDRSEHGNEVDEVPGSRVGGFAGFFVALSEFEQNDHI